MAAPGMVDRLNPDFSRMSDTYRQAIGSTPAHQLLQAAMKASAGDEVIDLCGDNSPADDIEDITAKAAIEIADGHPSDDPNWIPTEKDHMKQLAMSGRGGMYFGDREFREFDRQGKKVPRELIDPMSKESWRLGNSAPGAISLTVQRPQITPPPPVESTASGHPPMNIFEHPAHSKKVSGKKRLLERVKARNTKNMHLGIKKNQNNKSRRRGRQRRSKKA